ncbi:PepSY domain-containing protein [Sterolibacterium denitrificans]|nr:PepSY domain-containing protein [Sterolibacterium denitrificans]
MKKRLLATFAGLALLAYAHAPIHADDLRDHDRARQALLAGEILPLRAILERIEREQPGQVMEVELEREHAEAGWIYEVKLLKAEGSLLKLKIDARTGEILGMKEKTPKAANKMPHRESR